MVTYLLIFEDGEIKQTDVAPTDSELESIEAGILSVIVSCSLKMITG